MKASRLVDLAVVSAALFCLGGPVAAQTVAVQASSAPAAATHAAVPLPPEKPTPVLHGTSAEAAPKPAAAASTPSTSKPLGNGPAHAYLFRGLMNIFSLGMDDLAQKIQQSGVAASVYNHSEWREVGDDIAAKYKAGNHGPIILIGHSLGADAVMLLGEYLGTKGVPVALIVPFDGTRSLTASGNVASVMNITQRDYAYAHRGYGFHGDLANIDVSRDESIGHISIDKTPRLHALVLNKIAAIAKRGGGPAQTAAPTNAPAIPPLSKPAVGSANLDSPRVEPFSGASAKFETATPVMPVAHVPSNPTPSVDSIPAASASARKPVSAATASSPATSLEYQRLGQ